jgi:FkbM family methyltransferase
MSLKIVGLLRKIIRLCHVLVWISKHPLHKGQRVRALLSFTSLALARKLTPVHQITIPYVGGAFLHWPLEATSVTICACYGLGEYADMAFCLHMLRDEDVFCDVGANAGVYTILAARAVGCRVIAIEPVPKTFDLLMQNIHLNGVSDRVDTHCCGIGHEPGRLFFTSSLWSYNHVVPSAQEHTIEVDVSTLDMILAGKSATMIKIDVEGFEAKVLEGATETLSDCKLQAVLIEMASHVERYGDSLDIIHLLLANAGFSGPWWYSPEQRCLITPGIAGPTRYNQIFVRNPVYVAARLAEAKRYEVHGTYV